MKMHKFFLFAYNIISVICVAFVVAYMPYRICKEKQIEKALIEQINNGVYNYSHTSDCLIDYRSHVIGEYDNAIPVGEWKEVSIDGKLMTRVIYSQRIVETNQDFCYAIQKSNILLKEEYDSNGVMTNRIVYSDGKIKEVK